MTTMIRGLEQWQGPPRRRGFWARLLGIGFEIEQSVCAHPMERARWYRIAGSAYWPASEDLICDCCGGRIFKGYPHDLERAPWAPQWALDHGAIGCHLGLR